MYTLNSTDTKKVSGGLLLFKDGDFITVGIQHQDEVFSFQNIRFTSTDWTMGFYRPIWSNQVDKIEDVSGLPDQAEWEKCHAVYVVNWVGE